MKKFVFTLMAFMLCFVGIQAENAQSIVSKVISNYKSNKSVSATYTVLSSQGNSSGSIVMSGSKFRILSKDLRCWFDGKTQWTYSSATGEVNVSNPSSEELQMCNPYAAAVAFKSTYSSSIVKNGANYVLKLLPKKKSGITSVLLTVSKNTYQIQRAVFTMTNHSTVTIIISKYIVGKNNVSSTFVFNKNLVPKGTAVVDLR